MLSEFSMHSLIGKPEKSKKQDDRLRIQLLDTIKYMRIISQLKIKLLIQM
jgi:hypothetical protein